KEESAKETASAPAESAKEVTSSNTDSRIKASPLAKKLAEEKGINLSEVKGSAEGGRIVKKDVEGFTASTKEVVAAAEAPKEEKGFTILTYVGEEKYTEQPDSQMREVIARPLGEGLFTAPHFYLTVSV